MLNPVRVHFQKYYLLLKALKVFLPPCINFPINYFVNFASFIFTILERRETGSSDLRVNTSNPACIYLFKISNVNTKIMCEIWSMLKIKTSQDIIDVILVYSWLALNSSHVLLWRFHCWLWRSRCQLRNLWNSFILQKLDQKVPFFLVL